MLDVDLIRETVTVGRGVDLVRFEIVNITLIITAPIHIAA